MKQIRQRIVERRTVPASELKRNPRNWRKHPDAQRQAVATMLEAVGWVDDLIVTVDADGSLLLVDGHLRADLADDQPVPIAVTDLTPAEADLVLGSLDSLAAMADSDGALLRELIGSLDVDALSAGLDDGALEASLAAILRDNGGIAPRAGLTDPDAVPEPPKTPITKTGDLWLLGDHRLLCGDSTKADDVERLMGGDRADCVFTDPPYGVGYDGGALRRDRINGDQIGTTIYADALPNLRAAAADHAALYLWYADAHAAAAAAAVAVAGYMITAQIIWLKNNAQFVTSAHYKGKHEPCYYAHRRGKTARWCGPNNEVTVWAIDRANRNEYHPTQKPVALAERALANSTRDGDIVLDLFGGSGSTIIAAERLLRRCYAMEIEPRYVDVSVARWEQYTGRTADLERAPKRRRKVAV